MMIWGVIGIFMVYKDVNNKMDFIALIIQVTLVLLYTC